MQDEGSEMGARVCVLLNQTISLTASVSGLLASTGVEVAGFPYVVLFAHHHETVVSSVSIRIYCISLLPQ